MVFVETSTNMSSLKRAGMALGTIRTTRSLLIADMRNTNKINACNEKVIASGPSSKSVELRYVHFTFSIWRDRDRFSGTSSENGGMAMSSRIPTKPPTKLPPAVKPSSCPQPLADRIASCALDHYHKQLTKKAKPKPGQEWTVFAAIVAFHRMDDRIWVVSSATGTKCTAQRYNEFILHDSHAEVLARRGFIRILFDEIMERESGKIDDAKIEDGKNIRCLLTEGANCSDEKFNIVEPESTMNVKQYQLDPNIGINLYISDSPCGDASIYRVPSTSPGSEMESNDINEILYTGAKVIVSEATKVDATDCGGEHQLLGTENSTSQQGKEEVAETRSTAPVVAREKVQSLGKLRTKSGRSNLPAHMRSHSHSCSDKIVLWSVLGLQGAMLTKYLNPPVVPLTSVVISIDSRLLLAGDKSGHNKEMMKHHQQQLALKRAIPDRIRNAWELQDKLPAWKPPVPTVHIVRKVYESGKAAMIATSEAKYFSRKKRKYCDSNEEQECSDKNGENGDCETNKTATTKPKKVPPCGMSFNWNQNEGLEVLVGSRGIKHGKKPKKPQDIEQLASRLCRARLMRDFSSLGERKFTSSTTTEEKKSRCDIPKSSDDAPPLTSSENGREYFQIKNDAAKSEWLNLKNRILTQSGSPLAGWLRCIKVDGDFSRV